MASIRQESSDLQTVMSERSKVFFLLSAASSKSPPHRAQPLKLFFGPSNVQQVQDSQVILLHIISKEERHTPHLNQTMPTYQIIAPKKDGGRLTQQEFQQCIAALQAKNALEKKNGCTLLRWANKKKIALESPLTKTNNKNIK